MGYMHPPHFSHWMRPSLELPDGFNFGPCVAFPIPLFPEAAPIHRALNRMGDELAAVEFEWPAKPKPIRRVGYLHRHLNAIRAKQQAARVTLELQRGWFNA